MAAEEWTNAEPALSYLGRADALPHRKEGEGVLLAEVSEGARRVLDLGRGDERLLAVLHPDRPQRVAVGLDLSKPMREKARKRFVGDDHAPYRLPSRGVSVARQRRCSHRWHNSPAASCFRSLR